jgi:hypothetical protein
MTIVDSGVAEVSTTRPKSANPSAENGLRGGMQVCSVEDHEAIIGNGVSTSSTLARAQRLIEGRLLATLTSCSRSLRIRKRKQPRIR